MWDFLARQILRQALKRAGKQAMGLVADEANGPGGVLGMLLDYLRDNPNP